jgi:hypothetical protein
MRIPAGTSEDNRDLDEAVLDEASFDADASAGDHPTQMKEFELPEPVAFFRPRPVIYSLSEPVAIPRPVPTVRSRPQPVAAARPDLVAEVGPHPVIEVRPELVAEIRQQSAIVKRVEERPEVELEPESNEPLSTRILRWAWPKLNRRYAKRHVIPGLVAYYWTGGSAHRVADMSATGLYLLTNERWAPGTLIQMTLHKEGDPAENSISVMSQLVRWGENGAGFSFIHADNKDVIGSDVLPGDAADRKAVESFLERMEASGV